jgi:hypothetical protein
MVIITRLYRSAPGYDTPVANYVRQFDKYVTEKGYTLSRWETHSKMCGWYTTVTYAIHKGDRPTRSDQLPDSEDTFILTLNQVEGRTERCTAYRKLHDLAFSFIAYLTLSGRE